jgi:signal transduction histidine kinase
VCSSDLRIAAGVIPEPVEYADAADSRIAETRALSRALHTMSERLRARLTYISEFAGNVSHEFKTPVSSLRGTVELLRDDEEMPPEQRARFLDNALHDLDRMSRLVGGLLRLARAEEGGAREPLDLGRLAAEVAGRYGVDVSPLSATIAGNAEQLDAVLSNLLENARRHGGPELRVDVRLLGEQVEVEVRDNGPGISPANLARIFDRFFTTDRARGGTGLGLALARTIAEAHGGSLRASSEPGDTRFTLALPLLPPGGRVD